MKTNGKPHPANEVQAVSICKRCTVGIHAIMINDEWLNVEGDVNIFLSVEIQRLYGLCPACYSQVGQEFVL